MNIVTLTMNPSVDKSATIDRVSPGKKLRCNPPRHDPGGGGINVSRAILRLDGESFTIYPRGGPTGAVLEQLLEDEGIQQKCLPIEEYTRQNLTILETEGGQHYRFVMPGPALQESEWQNCLDELLDLDPAPDFVVASGSLPRNVPVDYYGRLANHARRMGSRFILDTSGEPLSAAAEQGVSLLKPNIRELKHLVRGEFGDMNVEQNLEKVTSFVLDQGWAEVIVVSLGAAGAFMMSRDGSYRIPAPTVPIKSKIGAGDSMVAGIVLGLSREKSVVDAVRYGVAAGAAAVMTPGTELCRLEDTQELYERIRSETEHT